MPKKEPKLLEHRSKKSYLHQAVKIIKSKLLQDKKSFAKFIGNQSRIKDHLINCHLDESKKENFMSKYFVIAAALVVLAVACNKKEETAAPAEGTTVEQTAPATDAPATEAAPVEAAPADAAAPAEAAPADAPAAQ
jgi:hypothetical protein